MLNALDLDRGDSRARERGEDDAAQGVAERVTVARVEAVYFVDALVLVSERREALKAMLLNTPS
jgi:hypothetical protein